MNEVDEIKVDVNQVDDRVTLDSTSYDSNSIFNPLPSRGDPNPTSEDPPQILHTMHPRGVLVLLKFGQFSRELKNTSSSGATESEV